MDEATKVAPTTSEIACVTPRSKVTGSISATTQTFSTPATIDLAALRTKCGTTGGASCGNLADQVKQSTQACKDAFCYEFSNSQAHFNGAGNTFVQDLGYYPEGFNPKSIADDNIPVNYKVKNTSGYQNTDGYSVSGQSLPLQENHIYAVATVADAAKKEYYYDLIYVSKINTDSSISVEMRIANKKE